jgi:hypothetical protein
MKKIDMNSVDLWFWVDFDFGMFFFGFLRPLTGLPRFLKCFTSVFGIYKKKDSKMGFWVKKT